MRQQAVSERINAYLLDTAADRFLAGGPPGYLPMIARRLTRVADRSADVREDAAKGRGELLRIALLAEPAVVAREDHRLGPESLRRGQRGAVGKPAL